MCVRSQIDRTTPIHYITKDGSRTATYDMMRNKVTVWEDSTMLLDIEVPKDFQSFMVWDIIRNTSATKKVEKFENILELEFNTQGAKASVVLMPSNTPLYRKEQIHQAYKRAKETLNAAINALTLDEMKAYGEYRLTNK
jgi:hypothetical protein